MRCFNWKRINRKQPRHVVVIFYVDLRKNKIICGQNIVKIIVGIEELLRTREHVTKSKSDYLNVLKVINVLNDFQ